MSINFFISYTAVDRRWAEWVAATLEEAGYSTVLQAWDFRPSQNFVQQMDQAMRESERTIAIVSRDYYRSSYAVPEWSAAVIRDPTGRRGTLLPIRVDDVVLEGIFATLTWIDLHNVRPDAARTKLLEGVSLSRVRPSRTPGLPEGQRPRFPGALPPVWRVPHDRNPTFTGRDEVLAALREGFATARNRPAIAALTGTGGIGKTAIAVEHCYRASADYQVVWWVSAARRESAVADLAALARPLKLDSGGNDLAAQFAAVRQWLDQHDQWLVILDEAENDATFRSVVPQGGGGHVIVTSRNPAWRRAAEVVQNVDVLESDTAVHLLEMRTGLPRDRHATLLADALGHLPLALELAGAFLERQGIGFRDYLRRLERSGGMPERGSAPPDYRHTLETVWAESLSALDRVDAAATTLLQLCAHVAPDDLPRWAILAGGDTFPEPLKERVRSAETLADLIAAPRSYSLINTTAESLGMHRLIQTAIRGGLDTAGQTLWAGAAVAMMAKAFPQQAADTRLWERSGRLLPHAITASTYAEELDVQPRATIVVLDRVATYIGAAENQTEVVSHRTHAWALAQRTYGGDIPVWLLNNHALWLMQTGDANAARPLLERAVALELAHGESASLGTYYVNLSELEKKEQHWDKAKALLQRAVAILDRHIDHPHPHVAAAHSLLGQVLVELGEFDDAAHEFERAVQLFEATLGPSSADTMHARGWLEGVRSRGGVPRPWMVTEFITPETIERDRGKALIAESAGADEAEERLLAAAAGGDHAAYFHLWQLLERAPDRQVEAVGYLERAVDASIPEALYWRGRQMVDEAGREDEAEQMLRAAIAAGQTRSWYDLGLLLAREPDRHAEAESAFRTALAGGHEEARNDLGLLLLETGREEEGEAELRETARRGHPRGLHNLGVFWSDRGRDEEAVPVLQEAIAAGYLDAHLRLGVVLDRLGRKDEAEDHLRLAAADGDSSASMSLGAFFEQEARLDDAEAAYLDALDAGDSRAAYRLAIVMRRQGREEDAARYFVEAADSGDPKAWFQVGVARSSEGLDEAAEAAYRNAIAGGVVFAWNNLGILLSGQDGRDADAEEAFTEAIRTGHPEGWHNLSIHLRSRPGREMDAERAAAFADVDAGPEALDDWRAGHSPGV